MEPEDQDDKTSPFTCPPEDVVADDVDQAITLAVMRPKEHSEADLDSWWEEVQFATSMDPPTPVERPVPGIAHFQCTPDGPVLDVDKPQPDYVN